MLDPENVCALIPMIARCPKCGKELHDGGWTSSGHVITTLGSNFRKVLFAACSEHFDEAKDYVTKSPDYDSRGYVGEWEPHFGLMLRVVVKGCKLHKPCISVL